MNNKMLGPNYELMYLVIYVINSNFVLIHEYTLDAPVYIFQGCYEICSDVR